MEIFNDAVLGHYLSYVHAPGHHVIQGSHTSVKKSLEAIVLFVDLRITVSVASGAGERQLLEKVAGSRGHNVVPTRVQPLNSSSIGLVQPAY